MRRVRTGVASAAIVLAVFAYSPQPRHAASSIEEQFKYVSIGSEDQEGLPYWIWQVLPKLFADKLPPGGYAALGMIWEPGRDVPIGFSKKSLWGVSRVAINCAFCHTRPCARGPARRERSCPPARRTRSIRRHTRCFSMRQRATRGSTRAT